MRLISNEELADVSGGMVIAVIAPAIVTTIATEFASAIPPLDFSSSGGETISGSGGGQIASGRTPTSGSAASQTNDGSTGCSTVSSPNGSSLSVCQVNNVTVVQSCGATIQGSIGIDVKAAGGTAGGSGNLCDTKIFINGQLVNAK